MLQESKDRLKIHWLSKVYEIHSANPVLKFEKVFKDAEKSIEYMENARTKNEGDRRAIKAREKFKIAKSLAIQVIETANKNIDDWDKIRSKARVIERKSQDRINWLNPGVRLD